MRKIDFLKKYSFLLIPLALSFTVVNCKKTLEDNGLFSIGGTVEGLDGVGLVLRNNGFDTLVVPSDSTSFEFLLPVPNNETYNVTIVSNPMGQECTVTNGSGTATASVSNIIVTCSALAFTIGGTIQSLVGSNLVIQNIGTGNLAIPSGATSFVFPQTVPPGTFYDVSVLTQPSGQTCNILGGNGIASANVTTIQIFCAP